MINPLDFIPVQPSQIPNRASFLNTNREVNPGLDESAGVEELMWDREINDQQIDHFENLMQNAGKNRKMKD